MVTNWPKRPIRLLLRACRARSVPRRWRHMASRGRRVSPIARERRRAPPSYKSSPNESYVSEDISTRGKVRQRKVCDSGVRGEEPGECAQDETKGTTPLVLKAFLVQYAHRNRASTRIISISSFSSYGTTPSTRRSTTRTFSPTTRKTK